jgi:hypothetical protein
MAVPKNVIAALERGPGLVDRRRDDCSSSRSAALRSPSASRSGDFGFHMMFQERAVTRPTYEFARSARSAADERSSSTGGREHQVREPEHRRGRLTGCVPARGVERARRRVAPAALGWNEPMIASGRLARGRTKKSTHSCREQSSWSLKAGLTSTNCTWACVAAAATVRSSTAPAVRMNCCACVANTTLSFGQPLAGNKFG